MKKTVRYAHCPLCHTNIPLTWLGRFITHTHIEKQASYECPSSGRFAARKNCGKQCLTDKT